MGKYFSNDADFTEYNLTDDDTVDTSSAMPIADNLTHELSEQTKEKLSRTPNDATNPDEYIGLVKEQTEQVTDMVQKFSEESKNEIKNQFDKFAPAELFEKLNQIIFVVAELNNKVERIEKILLNNGEIPEEKPKVKIDNPAELHALQENNIDISKIAKAAPQNIPELVEKKDEKIDINEAKKRLADIKSGKAPEMPKEDYIDKGVNLEEMFPHLDDEAYQAAYSSMAKSNKQSHTEKAKPKPGNMRNITGF